MATSELVEGGINDLARGGTASDEVRGYAAILRSIPIDKHIILVGILPVEEPLISFGLRRLLNNSRIADINAQLCLFVRIASKLHARPNPNVNGHAGAGLRMASTSLLAPIANGRRCLAATLSLSFHER